MTALPTVRGADLAPLGWQHASRLDRSQFRPVSDDGWVKPKGGLWTATLVVDDDGVVADTSWARWCRGEDFGDPTVPVTVVVPEAAATVYVINSVDDLAVLESAFFQSNGLGIDMWPQLSWERAADVLDAIWLTDAGQWATRFSRPGLYGWDCETVLWLQPRFTVGATAKLGEVVAW